MCLQSEKVLSQMQTVQERPQAVSYIWYNPNPCRKSVGDCTIRAISKALGHSWEEVYAGLALEGFRLCDMPSANHVWGSFLHKNGFTRQLIPDRYPNLYTVSDFAADHPMGTYILAISGHVVCVKDGDWYDTWDSGMEAPAYYWEADK